MLAVCLLLLVGTVLSAPETYQSLMEIEPDEPVRKTPEDIVLSYRPYEAAWVEFKRQYGKSYGAKEELHRYNVFLNNVAYIESHNELYMAGQKSFYLGLNQLADLELEEFTQRLNGFRNANHASTGSTFLRPSFVTLPDSIDWREKGYVTPVKNQGSCGSAYAFSATGSLEGQHFKLKHKLVSLSEQQLVDCSLAIGNMGCHGGWMDTSFLYLKTIRGIDSEKSYPYLDKQGKMCKYNRSNVVTSCTGYVNLTKGSETDLQYATATVGPISVGIDANHKSFHFYRGGVYDEPKCSQVMLNHGVLVVGYGVSDGGLDYWIVKNSQGLTWGNEGYIWMSRNKDNQCGIASCASYPLI